MLLALLPCPGTGSATAKLSAASVQTQVQHGPTFALAVPRTVLVICRCMAKQRSDGSTDVEVCNAVPSNSKPPCHFEGLTNPKPAGACIMQSCNPAFMQSSPATWPHPRHTSLPPPAPPAAQKPPCHLRQQRKARRKGRGKAEGSALEQSAITERQLLTCGIGGWHVA